MSLIYWGKEITAGKPVVFTPPYMYVLQLSNIALEYIGNQKKRQKLSTKSSTENKVNPSLDSRNCNDKAVRVYVETEDLENKPIKSLLCTLRYETIEQVSLNIVFSWDSAIRLSCEYSENGPDYKVHIVGYLQPGPAPDDSDEEDDMGMPYPLQLDTDGSVDDDEDDYDDDDGDYDLDDHEDNDGNYELDDIDEDGIEYFNAGNGKYQEFFTGTESDDSETEMGRAYDISEDAIGPEEVKKEREKRYEENKKSQQNSIHSKRTHVKSQGNHKEKDNIKKNDKLGKDSTEVNDTESSSENDDCPEEVSSKSPSPNLEKSFKVEEQPKQTNKKSKKKHNKKRKRPN